MLEQFPLDHFVPLLGIVVGCWFFGWGGQSGLRFLFGHGFPGDLVGGDVGQYVAAFLLEQPLFAHLLVLLVPLQRLLRQFICLPRPWRLASAWASQAPWKARGFH